MCTFLAQLRGAAVVAFGAPRAPFSRAELDALRTFVHHEGGGLLLCAGEGGDARAGSNLNELLEALEAGVAVNADGVVRTVYHKYPHPKEVLVADGVLNRELARFAEAGRSRGATGGGEAGASGDDAGTEGGTEGGGARAEGGAAGGASSAEPGGGLSFVYPYGCTLSVHAPAAPLLSTGRIGYPASRPVLAAAELGKGRVVVAGSAQLFSDTFLDKEDNNKVMDFVLKWLVPEGAAAAGRPVLNAADAADPDVAEHERLPDTEALSERLRSCLQAEDALPKDFTSLFSDKLFGYSNALVPEVSELYKELNVPKKPLTLIPPAFEAPLPPLQPAVFPPIMREPPQPALELFDLDSELASSKSRLAALCNKCGEGTPEDVAFFIQEAGEIMGVSSMVAEDDGHGGRYAEPKAILAHVFKMLASFKCSEPLD